MSTGSLGGHVVSDAAFPSRYTDADVTSSVYQWYACLACVPLFAQNHRRDGRGGEVVAIRHHRGRGGELWDPTTNRQVLCGGLFDGSSRRWGNCRWTVVAVERHSTLVLERINNIHCRHGFTTAVLGVYHGILHQLRHKVTKQFSHLHVYGVGHAFHTTPSRDATNTGLFNEET